MFNFLGHAREEVLVVSAGREDVFVVAAACQEDLGNFGSSSPATIYRGADPSLVDSQVSDRIQEKVIVMLPIQVELEKCDAC